MCTRKSCMLIELGHFLLADGIRPIFPDKHTGSAAGDAAKWIEMALWNCSLVQYGRADTGPPYRRHPPYVS